LHCIRHIKPQIYPHDDLDLSGSHNIIGHVTIPLTLCDIL